jgi:flagellar basal-body rod protein FlgG
MAAQQLNVETISNNLANMATPGFKRSKVSFVDLVNQGSAAASSLGANSANSASNDASPLSHSFGAGVSVSSVDTSFDVGDAQKTGSPLDLMINGDGFLEVVMPDGSRAFSRGGSLKVASDGALTTQAGQVLKANITVPDGMQDLTIGADGKVSARASAQANWMELGQLPLVRFNNEAGLESLGDGLYRTSDASGDSISGVAGENGMGSIKQGYVEGANVKLVDEYVGLMMAQRAYEASVKVVQASDEMLSLTNNLRK